MTKQELIDELNILANLASDAEAALSDATDGIRRISRKLEDLPSEPNEIEDDEDVTEGD